jgi:hypothetical protein
VEVVNVNRNYYLRVGDLRQDESLVLWFLESGVWACIDLVIRNRPCKVKSANYLYACTLP